MARSVLSRTVRILSFVSLFNDVASEMLYPVMPVYLKSIGFSVLLIGVLEGLAEAVSGISKGYFGNLSDRRGVRLPLVRIGYALSTISKPMFGILKIPLWVFGARTLDRFGKGMRTNARDAMLSDEATPETKGAVFGFHRAMDTTGAVLGPLFALVYLYYAPHQYISLFYFAFVPGALGVLLLFVIKEKESNIRIVKNKTKYSFWSFLHYWQRSSLEYKKLLAGLLFFTLFNSSDYFLLMKVKQNGYSDTFVIGIYIFYNLVYTACSYPLGKLGDKIGLKNVLLLGLFLFSIVYFGMAFASGIQSYIVLFIVYGVYSAASEGISKAWVSNIAGKNETATALGTFTAFQSICTMLASFFAGLVWYQFGASRIFVLSGAMTISVCIYLYIAFKGNRIQSIE